MRSHAFLRFFQVFITGVFCSCIFSAGAAFAETQALPEGLRGLRGTIAGVVAATYKDGKVRLQVTKVLSTRDKTMDSAKLVGRTIEVRTRFFLNAKGGWEAYAEYVAYLKALKRGTKVTLKLANWSRDYFNLIGLTPEQLTAVGIKPDEDMLVMPEGAKLFRGVLTGTMRGTVRDGMGIKLRIEKVEKITSGSRTKDDGASLINQVIQVVPNFRKDKDRGWVAIPAYETYLKNLKKGQRITVEVVNYSNQIYFTMRALPAGASLGAQPVPKVAPPAETAGDDKKEFEAEDANDF